MFDFDVTETGPAPNARNKNRVIQWFDLSRFSCMPPVYSQLSYLSYLLTSVRRRGVHEEVLLALIACYDSLCVVVRASWLVNLSTYTCVCTSAAALQLHAVFLRHRLLDVCMIDACLEYVNAYRHAHKSQVRNLYAWK